ncbi:MAG: class I adenylate cyclase [Reinekea sp.]|jgi:adenylate cyclase, class 1
MPEAPQPDDRCNGFIQSRKASSAHVQHVISRFMTVNEGRMARIRDGLQVRQQQCFDLLPLLFHTNVESLPGYTDNPNTPQGFANYHPDDALLRLARILTRGQVSSQLKLSKPQLSALYLMGSSGSIGQSTSSDLDIWICYDSGLNADEIQLLEEKSRRVTNWGNGFNLEIHFFLMDSHQFQGGEQQSLTGENCGSTQHTLLLDEFYRSVVVLAGNIPAWWLIPTECESDYQNTLQGMFDDGLINAKNCTDFGAVGRLPAGEFIGAGLWQIYKAIDRPYKSVLKLILLEIYASQYPDIESLAHKFKKSIYRMQLSLNDLDPYVMLYNYIEDYLTERDELQRLALIRRCFYFKVGLNLSKKNTRTYNWRRELLDYLVHSWGWTAQEILHLDKYRSWTVEQVLKERRLLVNELTHSYRFLTEFAAEHHSEHMMSQRDLLILSRKLHAAFDRRPGKIDFINIGLEVDLSHERVRLYERESKTELGLYLWAAYNKPLDEDPAPSPLKYSKSFLETLLWCHLNGLISAHLHIPVFPKQQKINEYEIRMTLSSMRQLIPLPMQKIKSTSFYNPAILTKVILFINLGRDPLHYLSAKGLQKISARSNSLDFSALRENLVLSLDMVLINNWGEVVVEHFIDDNAMAKALKFLVNRVNKQSRSGLPVIHTVCHNQTRPQAIAKRIQDLFDDALSALCHISRPQNTRFIFSLSEHFLLFQRINKVTQFVQLDSQKALEQHLSQEQAEFSPVVFDRQFHADNKPLGALFRHSQPNRIIVGFSIVGQNAQLYLIDEQGSLVEFAQSAKDVATLLAPLVRFLKITEHRQNGSAADVLTVQRDIHAFQIQNNDQANILKRIKLEGLLSKGRYISIQANVDMDEQGKYSYLVNCNEREFLSTDLGNNLYNTIASFVLGLRMSGEKYPIYITDLALSESVIEDLPFGRDQTLHYIQLKLKLEKRINEAMDNL